MHDDTDGDGDRRVDEEDRSSRVPHPVLDVVSNRFGECAHCESYVDLRTWTPTVSRREGGDVVIHKFCDEECRSSWRDD